jgi:RNase adaptor protein for sRNA GlmZ degradation
MLTSFAKLSRLEVEDFGKIGTDEEAFCHEEGEVHEGADRLRIALGRTAIVSAGCTGGHHREAGNALRIRSAV